MAVTREAGRWRRYGTALPLFSEYAQRRDDLVSLADRRDRLRLLAFPRGRDVADFNRRGEIVSRERGRSWKLRVEAHRRRATGVLRSAFAGRSVRLVARRRCGA